MYSLWITLNTAYKNTMAPKYLVCSLQRQHAIYEGGWVFALNKFRFTIIDLKITNSYCLMKHSYQILYVQEVVTNFIY